jgi:hypothetical protein
VVRKQSKATYEFSRGLVRMGMKEDTEASVIAKWAASEDHLGSADLRLDWNRFGVSARINKDVEIIL